MTGGAIPRRLLAVMLACFASPAAGQNELIFWRNADGIQRANLDGTDQVTLFNYSSEEANPWGRMDIDDGYLYFEFEDVIHRSDLDGGNVVVVDDGQGFEGLHRVWDVYHGVISSAWWTNETEIIETGYYPDQIYTTTVWGASSLDPEPRLVTTTTHGLCSLCSLDGREWGLRLDRMYIDQGLLYARLMPVHHMWEWDNARWSVTTMQGEALFEPNSGLKNVSQELLDEVGGALHFVHSALYAPGKYQLSTLPISGPSLGNNQTAELQFQNDGSLSLLQSSPAGGYWYFVSDGMLRRVNLDGDQIVDLFPIDARELEIYVPEPSAGVMLAAICLPAVAAAIRRRRGGCAESLSK